MSEIGTALQRVPTLALSSVLVLAAATALTSLAMLLGRASAQHSEGMKEPYWELATERLKETTKADWCESQQTQKVPGWAAWKGRLRVSG